MATRFCRCDSGRKAPRRNVFGRAGADPLAEPAYAFTQNFSTDLYELVQFTLKMVVDPRDIPTIIDGICKDKFHTLLNISYAYDRQTLENLQMEGRIYGDEPAVIIMMDFETVFFGEIYRRIMPEANLNEIGKTRPDEESDDA